MQAVHIDLRRPMVIVGNDAGNTVISGNEITSAHETVCHAPSSRASRPPSAYPTAAATTAPINNRSAVFSMPRPSPCNAAKPTAQTAPRAAAIQNRVVGCSLVRSTAATAVAAGSSAITTAPWAAGAVVNANDVSNGKPTTTPPATTASRRHWVPRGNL